MQELCIICNQETKPWAEKNSYVIRQCKCCGFGNVYPHLSAEQITNLYSESGHNAEIKTKRPKKNLSDVLSNERLYPNSSADAERITAYLKRLLPSGGKILDVGAGYGIFSSQMIANDFKVDAIEMAQEEASIFEELNNFNPYRISFESFEGSIKYDAILMSQILEHAADPNAWIIKSFDLLKPDGIICIASPYFGSLAKQLLGKKEPYIIPPYHLNYFTKKSISLLLEKNGFQVLMFHTVARLPLKKIFTKYRVPGLLHKPLAKIGQGALSALDLLKWGSIFNVYAKKNMVVGFDSFTGK